MECRDSCAACCIAPNISSAIPGMPNGKPAGEYCAQLDDELKCKIFGDVRRPHVCLAFKAEVDVCGENREQAISNFEVLEKLTRA